MERELMLLGLLRREDMHGYQLHEFINQNMSSCVDLKKPTAYYLLDKLQERGWISQTEEQAGNRPTRYVYQITAAGEAAFQRLLREHLATDYPARFTGDIGLAFLDQLPAGEARDLLAQRQQSLSQRLEQLQQVPEHAGSFQLMIDHHIRHLQSELDWMQTVFQYLEDDA